MIVLDVTAVQVVPLKEYSSELVTPVTVPSAEDPLVALVEPSPVGTEGRPVSVTATHTPAFVVEFSALRTYIFGVELLKMLVRLI